MSGARNKKIDSTSRLLHLRTLMKKHRIVTYLVPSIDAHGSLEVADCDQRRSFISGFNGSSGTAVITIKDAFMLTVHQNVREALEQVDKNWSLVQVGLLETNDWIHWVVRNSNAQERIGIDPSLISKTWASRLLGDLLRRDCHLIYIDENLVDCVWGLDRPQRSTRPLQIHDLKFAGESSRDKVKRLRARLSQSKSDGYVASSLADIAWILNVRGSDFKYNPFTFCHLFIPTPETMKTVLFIDGDKLGTVQRDYLCTLGVETKPYTQVHSFLQQLESISIVTSDELLSVALAHSLPQSIELVIRSSPITQFKAIKNEVEIEGLKRAYLRDSSAWCRWAAWLEETIKSGTRVSEWEAAEKLTVYRQSLDHHQGLAYANISATNKNAVYEHYNPTEEVNEIIDLATPYLNDSGPQYLDGTIDTTRTVHYGTPTQEQKLAYTVVLQGHIAVASAVFPVGTTGSQLDTLGRAPGWKHGLTYSSDTGHGIGSFGLVEEGPQELSPDCHIPLMCGHTTTIEPGHYKVGSFGVRIESSYVVQQVKSSYRQDDVEWLHFERLTQIPIAKEMVDWSMMSLEERKWLEQHNEDCRRVMLPLVGDDERAVEWLQIQ